MKMRISVIGCTQSTLRCLEELLRQNEGDVVSLRYPLRSIPDGQVHIGTGQVVTAGSQQVSRQLISPADIWQHSRQI